MQRKHDVTTITIGVKRGRPIILFDDLDCKLRNILLNLQTADVTENKYSPKISTPQVLISWEISTPPELISREICTPLGKKVLPRRALRDGEEKNNLCP